MVVLQKGKKEIIHIWHCLQKKTHFAYVYNMESLPFEDSFNEKTQFFLKKIFIKFQLQSLNLGQNSTPIVWSNLVLVHDLNASIFFWYKTCITFAVWNPKTLIWYKYIICIQSRGHREMSMEKTKLPFLLSITLTPPLTTPTKQSFNTWKKIF